MELLGVRLELPANAPVVLLREQSGERRVLPIYIGPEEARAIALSLEGVSTPRPMTHDLFRDVLGAVEVSIVRITVTDLRESTFFAEIELQTSTGDTVTVSSRPSDAVALAVRVDAPIFAAESVLAEAAMPAPEEGEEEEQEEIVDQFRQFIDEVNPEDFAS
jgi:bifunctional DNase/RNase